MIGISHAAILAPLLRADDQRSRIIAEAGRLADELAELVARGEPPPSPAGVLQRLTAAVRSQTAKRRSAGLKSTSFDHPRAA